MRRERSHNLRNSRKKDKRNPREKHFSQFTVRDIKRKTTNQIRKIKDCTNRDTASPKSTGIACNERLNY